MIAWDGSPLSHPLVQINLYPIIREVNMKLPPEDRIKVWLSGVQPDLIHAFQRLDFFAWYDATRLFPSKNDDNSSTIQAIRRIRQDIPKRQGDPVAARELSYQA